MLKINLKSFNQAGVEVCNVNCRINNCAANTVMIDKSKMKKLLLILLLLPANSFAANGECHRQSNPFGYANYDVCEVAGTGYSCVSLEGKGNNGISCFPTPKAQNHSAEKEEAPSRKKYQERESW